jgi:hypothetical protein
MSSSRRIRRRNAWSGESVRGGAGERERPSMDSGARRARDVPLTIALDQKGMVIQPERRDCLNPLVEDGGWTAHPH